MPAQSPPASNRTEPRQHCTRTRLVLAAMLLAVLTLSGCYKADVKVSVNSNDTMTGNIFIGVSPTAGADAVEALDPATIMTIVPGAVVTDHTDADGYRGRKVVFTGVPLDSLANPALKDLVGVEILVTRKGDQFVLDGSFDGTKTKTISGSGDSPTQIHASFTFPGEVGETNGTVSEDGRTVSWAPAGGETITMNADASAVPSNQTVIYAAYAGGALALLLIVVFVWRRIGPEETPADAAPVAPTTSEMRSKKQPKVKTRSVKNTRKPVEIHQAAPVRQIVEPPSNWWDSPDEAIAAPAPYAPEPPSSPSGNQDPLAHGGEGHPLPFGATPDVRNEP